MSSRAENARKFPYQYEGRRGKAARLAGLGIVNPNGWRQDAPTNRYAKGRAPDESVASYIARLGRGEKADRSKAQVVAGKNVSLLQRALSSIRRLVTRSDKEAAQWLL